MHHLFDPRRPKDRWNEGNARKNENTSEKNKNCTSIRITIRNVKKVSHFFQFTIREWSQASTKKQLTRILGPFFFAPTRTERRYFRLHLPKQATKNKLKIKIKKKVAKR